tara:strand:- start:1993 stop:2355 length:363 start_codon:yes stop_codon:yes gene_type:complete
MTLLSVPNTSKKRRRFPAEFKAKIVEACLQTDVSVAKIALKHGINTNLVHKWIRTAQQQDAAPMAPAFLPVVLPAHSGTPVVPATDTIRIELPRAGGTVIVNWPIAQADRCLPWLQALLA